MLKNVAWLKSSAEAGLVISLLKNNGFQPLELQTSPHVSFAGADLFYYVQIPDQEYEAAKEFLIKLGYKNVVC